MNQDNFLYCISQDCQIEKKLCDNLESVYLHSKDNHKLVKLSDLNQIMDNEYALIPKIKNQINETNQQVLQIKQLVDQTQAEIQQRYLQAIKELDKENQIHIKINGDKVSQIQHKQIIQNIEREVLQQNINKLTLKLFQNFRESISSFKKEILEELNIQLQLLVDNKNVQLQDQQPYLDDSIQQQQIQQQYQTPTHYLQDGPQQIAQNKNIQQNDAQVQQKVLEQEKEQLTRKIFIFNQTLSDGHMKKSDKMITAKDQSLAFIHEDFHLSKRENYVLKLQLRELDSKIQTLIRIGVIKSIEFKRKSFKTVLIGQYGAENGGICLLILVLIQSDKQIKSDDVIFKGDSKIKLKLAANSHMLKLKIDGRSVIFILNFSLTLNLITKKIFNTDFLYLYKTQRWFQKIDIQQQPKLMLKIQEYANNLHESKNYYSGDRFNTSFSQYDQYELYENHYISHNPVYQSVNQYSEPKYSTIFNSHVTQSPTPVSKPNTPEHRKEFEEVNESAEFGYKPQFLQNFEKKKAQVQIEPIPEVENVLTRSQYVQIVQKNKVQLISKATDYTACQIF